MNTTMTKKHDADSQSAQILRHLNSVGPLTSMQAIDRFGCTRLAARVADLKAEGYDILTEKVKVQSGCTVARYSLANPEQPSLF